MHVIINNRLQTRKRGYSYKKQQKDDKVEKATGVSSKKNLIQSVVTRKLIKLLKH